MRAIPIKMRSDLEQLIRMKQCAVKKMYYGERCEGRIEWHHPWTYAGSQINELWAIVGACSRHHKMVNENPTIKDVFERESLLLATEKDLARYPRTNWNQHLKRLTIHDLWHRHEK